MNIKRAFLTAAAVLMVPGFAMAQSTVTFSTSVSPMEAGTPDLTITCNNGFPLQQTAPAGTTFVVQSIMEGAECTVGMASDLDAGWEADGYVCGPFMGIGTPSETPCVFTMDASTTQWHTAVNAVPMSQDFTVNYEWIVSDDADEGVGDNAQLHFLCMNVWDDGMLTTIEGYLPGAGPDGVESPFVLPVIPDPAGTTGCYADMQGIGSAVEIDSDCAPNPTSITVGEGGSCSITITAFYEGIPTLSQYGMAIMALLMLGVGFVGFRRFV